MIRLNDSIAYMIRGLEDVPGYVIIRQVRKSEFRGGFLFQVDAFCKSAMSTGLNDGWVGIEKLSPVMGDSCFPTMSEAAQLLAQLKGVHV
jgi:hypothetical protein